MRWTPPWGFGGSVLFIGDRISERLSGTFLRVCLNPTLSTQKWPSSLLIISGGGGGSCTVRTVRGAEFALQYEDHELQG